MPTWGELLRELKTLQDRAAEHPDEFGGASPHDVLRRRYLRQLEELTGRAVLVYATAWMENRPLPPTAVSINLSDVQGFMEAVSNVDGREVDLFLHTPGGSAEAAESIVDYLRSRFDHIRAVVPLAAMSAGTMLALAADEIVMGSHSQLGPIDPQFTITTPEGPRSAPADAIKEQFRMAQEACAADPSRLAAWLPILRMYGPGLLAQCEDQVNLSRELVGRWLEAYMFAGEDGAAERAQGAAAWFSEYPEFRSHGRRVNRQAARDQGLKVVDLEADDQLQDAILSVHHTVRLTLSGTPAAKLIENHRGRAYIEIVQAQLIPGQGPAPAPTEPPALGRRTQPPPRPKQKRSRKRR